MGWIFWFLGCLSMLFATFFGVQTNSRGVKTNVDSVRAIVLTVIAIEFVLTALLIVSSRN